MRHQKLQVGDIVMRGHHTKCIVVELRGRMAKVSDMHSPNNKNDDAPPTFRNDTVTLDVSCLNWIDDVECRARRAKRVNHKRIDV